MALGELPAGRMVKRAGPWLPWVRMTATSPEWASAARRRCSSAEKARASGAEPVWTLPDRLAVVDAVEADGVGAEVGDPEGAVVGADDAVDGLAADGIGAADLVGPGGDLGDAVGAEVGDEDLAAVGLEGEVDGGLADVEEGEEVVGGEGGVLSGGPGVGCGGEADGHDLMSGGAGDEGFGGVGEDDGVGGSGAAGEGGAEMEDGAGGRDS